MKRLLFIIIALGSSITLFAQDTQMSGLNMVATGSQMNTREEELYRHGTQDIDESKWGEALQIFEQVVSLKGGRADGSLYWKAYVLNRLGRRQESLDSISILRNAYPKSEWLTDAGALELEVKQAMGKQIVPDSQADEEDKLLALSSIMASDPDDRVISHVETILNNPKNSLSVKDRALFVLAESNAPMAQQILTSIARGRSGVQLQTRAIQYLGIEGSQPNMKVLGGIYSSTQDAGVKLAVLRAYLVGDDRQAALAVAKLESKPDLKQAAISTLGAMDAKKELADLYRGADSTTKYAILDACVLANDADLLVQVANNIGEAIEIRQAALQRLGTAGDENTKDTLVKIYRNESRRDMKSAAIEGLFLRDDAKDLIMLARSEKDPQMRQTVLAKLALMDSSEAKKYILEILDK